MPSNCSPWLVFHLPEKKQLGGKFCHSWFCYYVPGLPKPPQWPMLAYQPDNADPIPLQLFPLSFRVQHVFSRLCPNNPIFQAFGIQNVLP
jgi:hypothetical protein